MKSLFAVVVLLGLAACAAEQQSEFEATAREMEAREFHPHYHSSLDDYADTALGQ